MTIEQIIEKVAEETGIPSGELSAASSIDDLGIDSLEFTDLMLVFDIPDSAYGDIHTLGDIATVLNG